MNKLQRYILGNNGSRIIKLVILAMLILPLKDNFSLAEVGTNGESALKVDVSTTNDNEGDATNVVNGENVAKYKKSDNFLSIIKTEIGTSEDLLLSVNRQIDDTQVKLDYTTGKIETLKDQIANLDQQIEATQKVIDAVTREVESKKSEIDTLGYQIEQKKVEISNQKQMLSEYLKVMFKDQADLNSFDEDEAYLNTVKLLLSDSSTSEKLRSIRYSEVLEEEGRKIFEILGRMIDEQQANQKILQVKNRTLIILSGNLADQKQELEVKKMAKKNLLDETKGEERIYQQLLAQSKANQEEVLSQIDTLRKNMAFVQQRMKTLGSAFNPDDYATLLNVQRDSKLLGYLTATSGTDEFAPIWPASPDRGVSAFYHEASYAKVFGMQHNAIDIRAYQSTPIKAVADGVVFKAKDNGYGYSYVMLAHANGFMTLYGHISKILVTEGQNIKVGDIIGLSGATPGTKGAGVYTTGPHLHFEVLKNGAHVDPLNYLNLAYLRLDSLPDKYLVKALGDKEKVRRMPAKIRNKSNLPAAGDVPVDTGLSENIAGDALVN